jgi:aryl-alcohol dehydrogenase-like predicted oxidoreductase
MTSSAAATAKRGYPLELRPFGGTGLQVSALGFGGGNIGYADVSDDILERMFAAALEAGVNLIDTAAMYGDSEEKVGRALTGRRQRCLICTKCGRSLPPRSSPEGFYVRAQRKLRSSLGLAEEYESLDWHPRALEWSINQSLRRLKTDYIDLLLLHSCSEETLLKAEVIEVLHRARKAGKVRFVGYSGDGPAALSAIECGQFQALEISVNIADQDAIKTVLPFASKQGLGVIAKRPLANTLWKSAARPDPIRYPHYQVYWERLRKLQYDFLPGDKGSEIALRFALSAPGVQTAIAGTANPEHLSENIEFATKGPLSGTQYEAIRSTWSKVSGPSWVGQM